MYTKKKPTLTFCFPTVTIFPTPALPELTGLQGCPVTDWTNGDRGSWSALTGSVSPYYSLDIRTTVAQWSKEKGMSFRFGRGPIPVSADMSLSVPYLVDVCLRQLGLSYWPVCNSADTTSVMNEILFHWQESYELELRAFESKHS